MRNIISVRELHKRILEALGSKELEAEAPARHQDEMMSAMALELKVTREDLTRYQALKNADCLVELEFPVRPRVRHGWGQPSEPRLDRKIAAHFDRYAGRLRTMLPMINTASQILPRTDDLGQPHWINDWLPAFDAYSLYCYLVLRNPPVYLEIGSGTSTKFARRAITDHGLRTKIISIDPAPRSEIDNICDKTIRSSLEEAAFSPFTELSEDDVLFFDGSHRSFQNSDATVFFTEILPALRKGVLVGIHDIFLPDDYPEAWLRRFYSEQYLLACWLLAGDHIKIELPIWYCSKQPQLMGLFDELWKAPNLAEAKTHGGIFWFTPQ